MKLNKLTMLTAVFAILLIALAGCGGSTGNDIPNDTNDDDSIVINCPDAGEKEISIGELKELEAISEEIITKDDNGEIEDQYDISGVLLEDVLAHLNTSDENLDTVRFTAGDGYSVEVPNHILSSRQIILAYEIDGEPLYEGTRPVRMYIPEEESMYWVKNTVEITLSRGKSGSTQNPAGESGPIEKIVFFETLQSLLDVADYSDEDGAEAVKAEDILADVQTSDVVNMLASDGFEKNEELDTFLENYIVVHGQDAPAFRGPELPRGMHVKNLVTVASGDTGFLFVESGLNYFDDTQVGEDSGINLKDLADTLDLEEAETYVLESDDGYTVEISYDDLEAGIVYIREGGELASAFEDLPKNTAVKYLLSISVAE